jgi:hypothetical protein
MPENRKLQPAFAGFRRAPGGNFAFTMVPNQFLDEIVPFEKPCVTKVVCLVLRRTLGWVDERGQRRQQEQVAYSEFAREMNMSVQAVADGVKTALEKGYLVRVKNGSIKTGEGAWYSLRWSETDSESQTPPDSEKQNPVTQENRVMINKPDSQTKKLEINASSTAPQDANCVSGETKKFSAYIGNLLTEISQIFGDAEHRLPNIKHALNLWDTERHTEKEFAALIYKARDLTRAHASTRDGFADPANRMPYFFRVLKQLSASRELRATSYEPEMSNQPSAVNRQSGKLARREQSAVSPDESSAIICEAEQVSEPLVTPETVAPIEPVISQPACVEVEAVVPNSSIINHQSANSDNRQSSIVNRQLSWASAYTSNPAEVLARWEQVSTRLHDSGLASAFSGCLGIEADYATPELRAAFGIENSSQNQLDIILLFRNAFDARKGGRYLAELQSTIEREKGQPVNLQLSYF